jgi:hypothetical protein
LFFRKWCFCSEEHAEILEKNCCRIWTIYVKSQLNSDKNCWTWRIQMADPNKCLSRCINWRNFGGGMNDPPWKKHSFMKMNLVSILAHIQLNAA